MSRLPVLFSVALLAVAVPAAAQQPPPRPSGPPPSGQDRIRMNRPYVAVMPGIQAEYETFLDNASGNNIRPQSLARTDLANRISTLIELGRCSEARALANEAGETQMALRARRMCRADRTSAD